MFLQYLINGLSVGAIYALIAIGYNMVYGILGLLNFAHGDVYAVGCFVTFWLFVALKQNLIVAIIGGLAAGFLLNMAVEKIAYRSVRFSGRIAPTISAVGIAYIMRNFIMQVWGPETFPFSLGLPTSQITFGSFVLGTLQIYILIIALLLVFVINLLIKKTKLGQAIVALSQSIPTAALMGIPINRVVSLVYGFGAVLGVIGGILFCTYYESIFVGIGFMLGTMKAWMASVIGGIGSLKGAFIGAMVLGLSESFVAGYISTAYRDAFVWGIFIIFILVKPRGLYPAQLREKV